MNILIIPSWYPWPGESLRGIFIKEQAIGLGQMRPGWKIAVAVWGQRRYTLSASNPLKTAAVLADFLFSQFKAKKHFLSPNVCEYRRPTIEWSKKWKMGNILGQERACRKILRRVRIDFGHVDLIHAHVTFPGGWIAMKLSLLFQLPYLITEHMGDFPFVEFRNANGTIKETISEPLRRAQAVIAVSPSQAERIAACGFPKPHVIPNMVDEDFFNPGATGSGNADKFVFFSLGTLRIDKGIRDLLQAAAIFLGGLNAPEQSRVEFQIGGKGVDAEEFRELGKEMGIDPWLRWLGPLSRSQAMEAHRRCDCFVLPSHLESFGMALLEALACGKPVIATRCGGPESMVTPENGLLVPAKDPGELAKALDLRFRGLVRFDGAVIRGRCLEAFSKKAVSGQIETLYRSIAPIK
ncbi:MAG: glycosyltransferase [Acidobacteria bacterium]|nr:glycosyltransferase [Acidobacteriota bacterium]